MFKFTHRSASTCFQMTMTKTKTMASSTSTIRATIFPWCANTCRSLRPCALAIGGAFTCGSGTGFEVHALHSTN